MKIYSIKEIIKATNSILDDDFKNDNTNKIQTIDKKLPPNIEDIIKDAETSLISKKKIEINKGEPLILVNEVPLKKIIDQPNYRIDINSEVKEHMISELYLYLKKKIKKNTLKLIIDNQIEIKNYKNKIVNLIEKEKKLSIEYQTLINDYKLLLENNRKLNKENFDLKNDVENFHENKKYLEEDIKQLKLNLEKYINESVILREDNNSLRNNLEKVTNNKNSLDLENKKIKEDINQKQLNNEESISKIRGFEINNSELKRTISRYISNNKKLQDKINLLENSNISKSFDDTNKLKFYQDENVRLSSELLSLRKNNKTIKENLNIIETEKQKIANKIADLNSTIGIKSNIISAPIVKEIPLEAKEDISKLNDKELDSLDEVIKRIFNKI